MSRHFRIAGRLALKPGEILQHTENDAWSIRLRSLLAVGEEPSVLIECGFTSRVRGCKLIQRCFSHMGGDTTRALARNAQGEVG